MVLQTKTSVIGLLLSCVLMLSCGNGNSKLASVSVNMDTLPSLHGESISSLISEGGITKYRLQTKVWDVYSTDHVSYWHFPKGAYLETFDSLFHVESTVKADTVYFFDKKHLWKLVGNVLIQNIKGERFETSLLFWNDNEPPYSINAIFTDSLVKIHKGDTVVISNGIRANQSMTAYRLYGNRVELPVDEI